jgi:hypothetical protein
MGWQAGGVQSAKTWVVALMAQNFGAKGMSPSVPRFPPGFPGFLISSIHLGHR